MVQMGFDGISRLFFETCASMHQPDVSNVSTSLRAERVANSTSG